MGKENCVRMREREKESTDGYVRLLVLLLLFYFVVISFYSRLVVVSLLLLLFGHRVYRNVFGCRFYSRQKTEWKGHNECGNGRDGTIFRVCTVVHMCVMDQRHIDLLSRISFLSFSARSVYVCIYAAKCVVCSLAVSSSRNSSNSNSTACKQMCVYEWQSYPKQTFRCCLCYTLWGS